MADRFVFETEGSGDFRCIPAVSVIAGEHDPEAPHLLGGYSYSELR